MSAHNPFEFIDIFSLHQNWSILSAHTALLHFIQRSKLTNQSRKINTDYAKSANNKNNKSLTNLILRKKYCWNCRNKKISYNNSADPIFSCLLINILSLIRRGQGTIILDDLINVIFRFRGFVFKYLFLGKIEVMSIFDWYFVFKYSVDYIVSAR